MEDLKFILDELKKITKDLNLPDQSILVDCATRIFISQNIQREKGRKEEINTEPRNEPATTKQKDLLIKLGYKGRISTLSKFEAGKLISEGIGK